MSKEVIQADQRHFHDDETHQMNIQIHGNSTTTPYIGADTDAFGGTFIST